MTNSNESIENGKIVQTSLVRNVSNGVSSRVRPSDVPWPAKTTRSKFTQTNKSIKRRVRAIKLSLNSGCLWKSSWKSPTKKSLRQKGTYRFCIICSARRSGYQNKTLDIIGDKMYIYVIHDFQFKIFRNFRYLFWYCRIIECLRSWNLFIL